MQCVHLHKATPVSSSNTAQSITIEDIAGIRYALASGRFNAGEAAWTTFTLSAAVEFAGFLNSASNSAMITRQALGNMIEKCPRFRAADSILQGATNQASFSDSNDDLELIRVGTMDGKDVAWCDYLQRFSDALARRGMDKKYARGLAESLHEMADNVVQHSSGSEKEMPRNIAGWHAFQRGAAFIVLDLGRGIRRSLAENPKWSGLTTDKETLGAVLHKHATRRTEVSEGNGFKDVVKNFVERNGVLSTPVRLKPIEFQLDRNINEINPCIIFHNQFM